MIVAKLSDTIYVIYSVQCPGLLHYVTIIDYYYKIKELSNLFPKEQIIYKSRFTAYIRNCITCVLDFQLIINKCKQSIYSHLLSAHGGCLLHLQPDDVPCYGDKRPQLT
jgi:hypothetical protein